MMYRPKSNVVFGNVNLADYGEAFAFYCNIFDKPARDVEVVSIPGRNGDLLYDNGRYKNVDRTYIIQVKGIDVAHHLIYSLLNTVGYQKLMDEYDTAYYYMARLKSAPQIIDFVGDAVKISVTFDRMPQRWLVTESELTQEATSGSNKKAGISFSVNNRTLSTATPIVRIDFSSNNVTSDITLVVTCGGGSDGNITLQGLSSGGSVVIDSEKRAIYNPSTLENMSGKIGFIYDFKWLTIPPGVESYVVGINATRDSSSAYTMSATLNTRTWEL